MSADSGTHAAFDTALKRRFGLSPSGFRRPDCRTASRLLKKGPT
jgi:hypothetical protein